MPKLVKDKKIVASDNWVILTDVSEIGDIPDEGKFAVPPALYTELKPTDTDEREIGLVIPGDFDLTQIENLIPDINFIAIEFPLFTDGRGFSTATLLRREYDFKGELRAVGNFMLDQLFYLSRCGFSSFIIGDNHSESDIEKCLHAFSESYQSASDEPQPLFRRRA